MYSFTFELRDDQRQAVANITGRSARIDGTAEYSPAPPTKTASHLEAPSPSVLFGRVPRVYRSAPEARRRLSEDLSRQNNRGSTPLLWWHTAFDQCHL